MCAGSEISFDTACEDRRVCGAALINGSFIDGRVFAHVFHKAERRTRWRYYRRHVFSLTSWIRLLTLKSKLWQSAREGVQDAAAKKEAPERVKVDMRGLCQVGKWGDLAQRNVKVLLIYSDGSVFFDIYRMVNARHIKKAFAGPGLTVRVQRGADHTFTLLSSQIGLFEAISGWLERVEPACGAAATHVSPAGSPNECH
jgi:hypothetical protein